MIKTSEIKKYSITQRFKTVEGTSVFGGHIYAVSWAEAEKLAKQMNAELDGIMIESQCARCGHTEIFNNSDEDGVDDSQLDVWDDEIE